LVFKEVKGVLLSEIWDMLGIVADESEQKEKALFRAIDTNNSGKISKQEMFNYLRKRL